MLVSGQIHAQPALVLVIVAYWRKIRLEERALLQAFGGEYRNYQHNIWALVPFVIRHRKRSFLSLAIKRVLLKWGFTCRTRPLNILAKQR
jgi:hypothetical protein